MSRTISLIQSARIASPCDMKWEDMTGDDRVRYCDKCELNVYNIRELTEAEANALLANATGRVCGRIWRRGDGTVITKDCPVGLAAVRRKVYWGIAKIAAAFVVIGTTVASGRSRENRVLRGTPWATTYSQTNQRILNWLNGPQQQFPIMGDFAMPTTNTNNSAGNSAASPDFAGE